MPRKSRQNGQQRSSKRTARRRNNGAKNGGGANASPALMGTNDSFPIMSPRDQVVGGFPTRMHRKLRYVETFTLDPGSANATMVYNLNGLYDPRVAMGGNQPSNFDVFMAVYNKYACHMCDIEVVPLNCGPDQTNSETGTWGFLITQTGNDISSGTTVRVLAEQPYVKYSEIPPGMKEAPYVALKARVPIWQFLGLPRKELVLTEENLAGTGSANPARNVYAEIFYASAIGNTVENPAYFKVELTFHTYFFLPRMTTASFLGLPGTPMVGKAESALNAAHRANRVLDESLAARQPSQAKETVEVKEGEGPPTQPKGWFG